MNILEEIIKKDLSSFESNAEVVNWFGALLKEDGLCCNSCGNSNIEIILRKGVYISGKCYRCFNYTHPLSGTMFKGTQISLLDWFRLIQRFSRKEENLRVINVGNATWLRIKNCLEQAFKENTIYINLGKSYNISSSEKPKDNVHLRHFVQRCELNKYTPSKTEISYVNYLSKMAERY
jgi:hypothetical protein